MASLPPKPPPSQVPSLAPGWTEHKAPTGHPYYYHAATKTSTYTRPVALLPPPAASLPANVPVYPITGGFPPQQFPPGYYPPAPSHPLPHRPYFPGQPGTPRNNFAPRGRGAGRGGYRPPLPKADKPKKKRVIPGAGPWVLVVTKKGRKFVHNLESKVSLWSAPKELQEKIDAMPTEETEEEKREREERRRRRRREREARASRQTQEIAREKSKAASEMAKTTTEGGGMNPDADLKVKRPRLEEQPSMGADADEEEEEEEEETAESKPPQGPQEFTEDDIAWQLEAMAEEYGLGDEDLETTGELAPEESIASFRGMLDDCSINPYSTWDDSLSRFIDDHRYTVLSTTKSRKQAFTEWCKDKIAQLREEKENAQKVDPRVPFWQFLKDHATAKLYWAEFKRKWRKEPVMKDAKLSDKDREKMFRDYVSHMKTSLTIREADLLKLLKSTSSLSRQTTPLTLPTHIFTDVRYVVVPDESRDSITSSYLSTLPSAPLSSEAGRKEKEERERREKALRDREWTVMREKRRNAVDGAAARRLLAEEEAAIERAKMVGKKGLLSHLKKKEEEESDEAIPVESVSAYVGGEDGGEGN